MLRIRENDTKLELTMLSATRLGYLHVTNKDQHSNRRGEISNYINRVIINNILGKEYTIHYFTQQQHKATQFTYTSIQLITSPSINNT